MSDKYNVYRAYAAFCQRMSRESQGEDRKLSWMRLAADWLALVRDSSPADQESTLPKNGDTVSADEQPTDAADAPRENSSAAAESVPDR